MGYSAESVTLVSSPLTVHFVIVLAYSVSITPFYMRCTSFIHFVLLFTWFGIHAQPVLFFMIFNLISLPLYLDYLLKNDLVFIVTKTLLTFHFMTTRA